MCVCVCVQKQTFPDRIKHEVNFKENTVGLNTKFVFFLFD